MIINILGKYALNMLLLLLGMDFSKIIIQKWFPRLHDKHFEKRAFIFGLIFMAIIVETFEITQFLNVYTSSLVIGLLIVYVIRLFSKK